MYLDSHLTSRSNLDKPAPRSSFASVNRIGSLPQGPIWLQLTASGDVRPFLVEKLGHYGATH